MAQVSISGVDLFDVIAAAVAVNEAWEEPEEPDDIAQGRIQMPGDEGDVEAYTPDVNEMVTALRALRVALGGSRPTSPDSEARAALGEDGESA